MKELPQVDLFTIEDYEKFIGENPGAVVYFSTPACNVCKVLKPKLKELLASDYPEMKFAYVNCEASKELAAQNQIFAVPTIQFLFEGKEFIRKSRNINLPSLASELDRPYKMMFE